MDKFIADTGPLIHLEQIGQLRLLKNLPQLYLPTSVISEIKQGGDIAASSFKTIKLWPNIKVVPAQRKRINSKAAIVINNAKLQAGETDCIYLAMGMQPCVLLSDDLSARITAEKLSLEVHGSIGLIAYGFRRKWLSLAEAEEALKLLYHQSSLFITYAIIEEAIHSLKNSA